MVVAENIKVLDMRCLHSNRLASYRIYGRIVDQMTSAQSATVADDIVLRSDLIQVFEALMHHRATVSLEPEKPIRFPIVILF